MQTDSTEQRPDLSLTTTKVRVDLSSGTLEAEGSEAFVRELYRDFSERVEGKLKSREVEKPVTTGVDRTENGDLKKGGDRHKAAKTNTLRNRTPVLVKDLDLAPKNGQPGLREFVKKFRKLKNSQEQNSLYVYYLAHILELKPISIDHVYTCYKHLGERVPGVLPQSLWDTARRKGTIETASLDDLKVTLVGDNWVEHDLEKAQELAD